MKSKLSLILCFCILFFNNMKAQDLSFKAASVNDPMYEWSQYDEKDMKAVLTKDNTLELENKNPTMVALAFMELPISLNDDDFTVNLLMGKASIKSDGTFGIIFNYKNDRNYTMLKFNEKQMTIYDCESGNLAVIKKVIYKINNFNDEFIKSDLEYKSDKNNILVSIERKNGKLQFYINGLYICSLKNYEIKYPTFGFASFGKNKLSIYGLEFAKGDSMETEE